MVNYVLCLQDGEFLWVWYSFVLAWSMKTMEENTTAGYRWIPSMYILKLHYYITYVYYSNVLRAYKLLRPDTVHTVHRVHLENGKKL